MALVELEEIGFGTSAPGVLVAQDEVSVKDESGY